MPRKRHILKSSAYRVVMDWWVAVGVIFVLLFLIGSLPLIMWSGLPVLVVLSSVLIISFSVLSFVDVAFFTYYLIDDQGLVITSQLRRYVLPFSAMTTVRSVGLKGLFTVAHRKRFALSARGYDIALEGAAWKVVSVSPELQDQFLDTLLSRIDLERSRHATFEV